MRLSPSFVPFVQDLHYSDLTLSVLSHSRLHPHFTAFIFHTCQLMWSVCALNNDEGGKEYGSLIDTNYNPGAVPKYSHILNIFTYHIATTSIHF